MASPCCLTEFFLFAFVTLFGIGTIPVSSLCRGGRLGHRNCGLLPGDDRCGVISVDQRVVGGHDAKLGEFPWIAMLIYVDPESTNASNRITFACGGSIINERYIVSAAHCLIDLGILKVRLGEYNVSSAVDCQEGGGECAPGAQDFEVDRVTPHPKYDPRSLENDLCLIRLKEDIIFTRYIHPICLPTDRSFKNERTLRGKLLDVAGWGVYHQEGEVNTLPDVLQTVSLPYVSRAQCGRIYERRLSSVEICAGGQGGRDACMGDSGGPLMGQFSPRQSSNRYFLVGVVSSGTTSPCGSAKYPGLYVNIAQLVRWMLDNIY